MNDEIPVHVAEVMNAAANAAYNGEQAMAVREPMPEQRAITPAQAKVDAVANLTMKAYERASTLALTADEIAKLTEEFPDEAFKPGAAGKEHLIYIEHAFLRDRLNQVFGPGQWAVIPRSRWAEEFKTNKGTDGSRIYVEAMLLIRGCFVAEAVGAMEYYPGNAAQNYGDAVEGAKTAALRRCAKELGVGLQAWKKDFCDGWWERRRGNRTPPPTRGHRQSAAPPAPQDSGDELSFESSKTPQEAPGTSQRAATTPKTPPKATQAANSTVLIATEEQKQRLLDTLKAEGLDASQRALMYFFDIQAIRLDQDLNDLPLRFVPRMASQMRELGERIAILANTGKAEKCLYMAMDAPGTPKPVTPATAQPTNLGGGQSTSETSASTGKSRVSGGSNAAPAHSPVPVGYHDVANDPKDDEAWRSFPMPWGKHAGEPLEDLDKKYLYGLWANYEVETEYNGKPKKPETIAKDQQFRDHLDAAGLHYGFTKND